MILALGLAHVPTTTKDRFDCLLARGVVHGDVDQVAGGTRLQVAKLVDQGLTSYPREESADDVRVDDIRELHHFRNLQM